MRPERRPVVTRKRVLLAASLAAALSLAGWLGARYVGAPWAMRRALTAAGLEPATFQITSVGLTHLRVVNLSAGAVPWLTAGTVDVTYSLAGLAAARVATIDVCDAVWTVQVQDGVVDWGPSPSGSPRPLSLDLPFDRAEVGRSVIRMIVNDRSYDVPMEMALISSAAGGVHGRLGLVALGGTIDLEAEAATDADVLTLELEMSKPVSLSLESAGVRGTLGSASGRLKVGRDGSGAKVLEGSLAVHAGSLHAGDAVVSDLEAGIAIRSPHDVELTNLTAIVGDGGTLTAAPFVLDPSEPRFRTRLSVTNLSLAEWLPLITAHHATGQGRISGSADISIDLTSGTPKVVLLGGALAADPQHGFIQVTDADSLADLLDAQDPRFATDETMRPVRDKIVAAFRDFAFSQLTVGLSRQDDRTVATAYVSGFGRHGDDPQGLNITLDLHVTDALLGLASRMASLSKVKSAAGSALDRFFGTPVSGEGHP
jgi:hypothetical protein